MRQHKLSSPWSHNSPLVLAALCTAGALLVTALVFFFGSLQEFEPTGISTASRTLNQFTAVVLTCIALIVPLTANLYTPKLVKLYVTHPLIVTGLSILLASHLMILGTSFFPKPHLISRILIIGIAASYLTVLAGALPFLFSISQFLRPSFFVPMLTRKGISNLRAMSRSKVASQNDRDFFEIIDVITNLALTGMTRSDRQLVLLALQSFHILLTEIIGGWHTDGQVWRTRSPHYVPGLAKEGQDYLNQHQVWPEAYVLAQTLKVMEMATKRQHEILAELASHLVDTAQLASVLQRDKVVELHLMAFNTLMREAIEEKDLRRYQNLSYHYRLLIEVLHGNPEQMHDAAQHLVRYGNLAAKQGLPFGLETIVYDLGELVLSLGLYDEERALELVRLWAGPLWQESIDQGSQMKKVGWRALLRVFWEAKALNLQRLTEAIYWRYLSDETIHREQVEMAIDENRELHYEFNDRLMHFAHLSPAAEELARQFTEDT